MQADLDGVSEICRTATDFDWGWVKTDVHRYAELAGWSVLDYFPPLGASLGTSLQVNRPEAEVRFSRRFLRSIGAANEDIVTISIKVTDYVAEPDRRMSSVRARQFADLSERITSVLEGAACCGPETGYEMVWRQPAVTFGLLSASGAMHLVIVNPRFQDFLARSQRFE
ncbi:DUF6301 family protein [Nocardia goodfellowii]|nr:DUF6301 family protein [Nocardia goodfellowii]